VNKLYLELVKGHWMISPEHAAAYLPVVARLLNREDISGQFSTEKITLQLHASNGKVLPILADTWFENPDTLFDNLEEEATLVIPVQGPITKYDNCGFYGAQTYAKVLASAAANNKITGILLHMDSPGGSADGSYDMAEAVAAAAKVKPVIAYADGLMASAAYRVAARATTIVAKPGSIIGSIGTMVTLHDYSQRLEDMGITEHRIYATASTEKNADYEQAIKGNYDPMRTQILDPLNNMFLQEMRDARNLPEAALTGKVFDPTEALKLGMIDTIGSYADALAAATTTAKTNSNSSTKKTPMNLGKAVLAFLGLTSQPDQLSQDQLDQLETLAGQNARMQETIRTTHEDMVVLNSQLAATQMENESLAEQVTALTQEITTLGEKAGADATQTTKQEDSFELPEGAPDQVKEMIRTTHRNK